MSEHTPLTEAERDELWEAVGHFTTNSPEAHPGVPHIADAMAVVVPAVERILAARTSTATADTCPGCGHPNHGNDYCGAATGYDPRHGDRPCGCPGLEALGDLVEAATADTGLRERVEAALDHTGEAVSCGGYSVDSDGCFVADLARRVRAALDATPASTEDRECEHEGIEHGALSCVGVCPRCQKCKFLGHGPLCIDCYDETCASTEDRADNEGTRA